MSRSDTVRPARTYNQASVAQIVLNADSVILSMNLSSGNLTGLTVDAPTMVATSMATLVQQRMTALLAAAAANFVIFLGLRTTQTDGARKMQSAGACQEIPLRSPTALNSARTRLMEFVDKIVLTADGHGLLRTLKNTSHRRLCAAARMRSISEVANQT
jgi:hypothetical protein